MARKERWDSIMIRHEVNNALKVAAVRESRSAARQLEWILRNAGLGEIDDKDVEKRLAQAKKGEQYVVAK